MKTLRDDELVSVSGGYHVVLAVSRDPETNEVVVSGSAQNGFPENRSGMRMAVGHGGLAFIGAGAGGGIGEVVAGKGYSGNS